MLFWDIILLGGEGKGVTKVQATWIKKSQRLFFCSNLKFAWSRIQPLRMFMNVKNDSAYHKFRSLSMRITHKRANNDSR